MLVFLSLLFVFQKFLCKIHQLPSDLRGLQALKEQDESFATSRVKRGLLSFRIQSNHSCLVALELGSNRILVTQFSWHFPHFHTRDPKGGFPSIFFPMAIQLDELPKTQVIKITWPPTVDGSEIPSKQVLKPVVNHRINYPPQPVNAGFLVAIFSNLSETRLSKCGISFYFFYPLWMLNKQVNTQEFQHFWNWKIPRSVAPLIICFAQWMHVAPQKKSEIMQWNASQEAQLGGSDLASHRI